MQQYRYAVNISAYIWAEGDEQAAMIADEYAKYLNAMPHHEDNKAKAYKLCEAPFGWIGKAREIELS